MKSLLISFIFIGLLLHSTIATNGVCESTLANGTGGCADAANATFDQTTTVAAGVQTCTYSQPASNGATCALSATQCLKGFNKVTASSVDTCTPCTGNQTTASDTAATCSACTTGQLCVNQSYAAPVADADQQTACPAGQSCTGGVATECAEGQFQASGTNDPATACAAPTSGTQIAGCQVYQDTARAKCAIAQAGYAALTTPSATVQKCVDNCDVCSAWAAGATAGTAEQCTTPQAGYLQKGTGSGTTLVACDAGCHTCNWKAGTATAETEQECTKVMAGYKHDATAKKAVLCPVGQGTAGADGHAETACVACTTGKNCRTCTQKDLCSACAAGYVPNATTATTCDAYDTTQVHVSCQLAQGATDADCNTCDAAKNREIETETVAPATTATPQIKGKCLCQAMFTEKATPDSECIACPANAATCTQNKDLTFKVNTCAKDFFLAGNACFAQTDSVAGFFWNTVPATSKFEACHASCQTCTAAGNTACVLCPDRPTSWVAPTETETNYATYLKAITNINNTCFSDCPSGWSANDDKTSCVEGSAGSASGIFSIILLIASLFMLI